MYATVVMLIAIGGLGCQNPVSELPPSLPEVRTPTSQPAGEAAPAPMTAAESEVPSPAPPSYPVYSGGPFRNDEAPAKDSFQSCFRKTVCSFFIGRDPDVPSARQIMEAYCAGQYNQ